MGIIDRLNELHWKYGGESPEFDFWMWLAGNNVLPDMESLEDFHTDVKENPEDYFSEEELRRTGYFKE